MSEVEQVIFKEDIRDKKKAGYGVFHRASRSRGFHGSMHTPVDLMTAKERKEYTKPGEVNTYYMDEKDIKSVKTIAEIEAMNPEAARDYLIRIKHFFTCKELREHWGYKSDYYLYSKLYTKFNVPVDASKRRGPSKKGSGRGSRKNGGVAVEDQKNLNPPNPPAPPAPAAPAAEKPKMTMSLALSGLLNGKDAQARVNALMSALQEGTQYKVFLTINEEE